MKKHFLMITTAASILACGTLAASAQDDSDTPNMQQLEQTQHDPMDEGEPGRGGHGMMRQCMRQCMSGDDMMGQRSNAALYEAGRHDGAVRHAPHFCVDGSRR